MSTTKLLWLNGSGCHGNAHSFLNYENLPAFFQTFEFTYHPIIESAYCLRDLCQDDIDCDILILEGSVDTHLQKEGCDLDFLIQKYGTKARYIVTAGTCAGFGGLFGQGQDSGGLLFDKENPREHYKALRAKTINLPGCPLHPEILVNTLFLLQSSSTPALDAYLRPKEFYGFSVHNGCTKNEYFEYKVESHEFGHVAGCMYYEHGCQGPFTKGSCNRILFNGVSSKTRAGTPCFGCNEPSFPRDNLFVTQKSMGVPKHLPFGVPKRAYLSIAGVAKSFKIDRLHKDFFDD